MSKLNKNISVYFIGMAGILLSTHLVIPHDHHFSDISSARDTECPVNDDQTHKHRNFPFHCRAFNDLTIKKANKFNCFEKIRHHQYEFIRYSEFTGHLSESKLTCFVTFEKPVHYPFFLKSYSLRAPPALA